MLNEINNSAGLVDRMDRVKQRVLTADGDTRQANVVLLFVRANATDTRIKLFV